VPDINTMLALRLTTGLGVAAYLTAATMYVADISTPLNRAKMLGPTMSGFAAGMALGPAVGGLLGGYIGIHSTFVVVGGIMCGAAVLNRFQLRETFTPKVQSDTLMGSVQSSISQWGLLFRKPEVRPVLLLNGTYWFAIAGVQMTLLPLILVGDFGYSVGQVGASFALMSGINVVVTQPVAILADRIGVERAIPAGGALCSAGMLGLSIAAADIEVAASLGCLALGTSVLHTLPTARMSNVTTVETRSQALALLRTMGDLGMLTGAAMSGYLADLSSTGIAVQSCASFLAVSSAWYGARKRMVAQ